MKFFFNFHAFIFNFFVIFIYSSGGSVGSRSVSSQMSNIQEKAETSGDDSEAAPVSSNFTRNRTMALNRTRTIASARQGSSNIVPYHLLPNVFFFSRIIRGHVLVYLNTLGWFDIKENLPCSHSYHCLLWSVCAPPTQYAVCILY